MAFIKREEAQKRNQKKASERASKEQEEIEEIENIRRQAAVFKIEDYVSKPSAKLKRSAIDQCPMDANEETIVAYCAMREFDFDIYKTNRGWIVDHLQKRPKCGILKLRN